TLQPGRTFPLGTPAVACPLAPRVRATIQEAVMNCNHCGQAAVFHVTETFGRGQYGEAHFCEPCGRLWGGHEGAGPGPEIADREPPGRRDGAARFVVARVVLSAVHEQQVVTLQEAGGQRFFPMLFGMFEAAALGWTIRGVPLPRPQTHCGWLNTIHALGAELQ